MLDVGTLFATLNLQVRNGKNNGKSKAGTVFEEIVFRALQAEGHETKTNEELRQEGWWRRHDLRFGKAIDGMVRFKGDKFWTPVQIKYTYKPHLEEVKGKFYECLPSILKACSASHAMIITNAEYQSENEYVRTFSGQQLVNLLKAHPELFTNVLEETLVPTKTFRSGQLELIDTIRDHFDDHDRGTIILPCGYGKTMISIGAVVACLPVETMKILMLVPNKHLVDQTSKAWIDTFPDLKLHLDVHRFDSSTEGNVAVRLKQLHKTLIGKSRWIIISTYQSATKLEDIEFDWAIFDECHRTVGLKNNTFGYLVSHGNIKKRLFLTATPLIVENETSRIVLNMVNENQYGKFLVNKGIKTGIEDGVLTPYEVICFAQEPEVSYETAFVNMLHQAIELGLIQKIIVFAHKHEQLNELHGIFTELFPDTFILRAEEGMKTSEQIKLAEQFSTSSKPVILLNCSVFVEGFDVPGCDAVSFYRGTRSIIRIVQGFGRALRLDPACSEKVARVLLPFVLFPEDVQGVPNADVTDITDVLKAIYSSDNSVISKVKFVTLNTKYTMGDGRSIVQEIIEIPEAVRSMILLQIIKGVQVSEYSRIKKEVSHYKLRNEEVYYEVRDVRDWPINPAEQFASNGFKWIDFLGHQKTDFWTLDKTRKAFQKYYRNERDITKAWAKMRQEEVNVPWYFEQIYGTNLETLVSGRYG
ncbi:MAG: DEAD/DEAH box helicase [Nitrososphaerales archaeon]